MKESPQDKNLERMLRSTKLAAGGFMGTDTRSPAQVISDDAQTLEQFGYPAAQVGLRMTELRDAALAAFGNWVEISPTLRVKCEEYKGAMVCPWPHSGRYAKRITTAERVDLKKSICWSDLNIHLISEHGFFEGSGAFFRIEPRDIVEILWS